ncbi:dockerin type I domain-containing protein [uncultured Ruminococcus sp.]|uniref:dockerin type I domain-containing protein n=1 Tax=uncultured Ruminococcus sp. TaxID=165186 RepID=UPI00292D7383|nr:dockerin type I domain-containing protein [uncultured Ruminococcus sp.]
MRRFLSILLAVMIIASVSVVSIGAADTGVAKVTMISVKGNSVTETYAVGDTITAYTYLNASQLNQGKIGSLDGAQYYTNSVLELTDEYTVNDGIFDIEGMFPITKTATMASGHWINSEEYVGMGAIYYNASIPSYSGFKFNSDTAALIVAHYKVKAAGDATIKNEMKTLAQSDYDLTRIIDRGKIVQSNFTSPVALSEPTMPVPTGSTVSGAITSYLKTEFPTEVSTVTLTGTDNNFTASVTGNTEYSFDAVPAGTYTLTVEKKYHATREYEITVGTEAVTQAVTINPLGDANLNGKVEARDAMKINQSTLAEDPADKLSGYAAQCADANLNGKVEARDAMRVFQQTQGGQTLYPTTD